MLSHIWSHSMRWCLMAILCVFGFSQFALATVDIAVYIGLSINKQIKFSDFDQRLNDSEAKPWMIGGDLFYQLPVPRLSAGLRYQYDFISDGEYHTNRNSTSVSPYDLGLHRAMFIVNYKVLDIDSESQEGPFLGILFGVDVYKYMDFKFGEPTVVQTTNDVESLTSHGWLGISPLSGQAGLEFGFKWTQGFFMKGEVGYSLLAFDNLKCDRKDCRENDPNLSKKQIKLHAPYVILGAGWSF